MKTTNIKAELNRIARLVGARVEDDSGGRWRVLQVCAPDGKQWRSSGGPHLRVEWTTPLSVADARGIVEDTAARVSAGLEDSDG